MLARSFRQVCLSWLFRDGKLPKLTNPIHTKAESFLTFRVVAYGDTNRSYKSHGRGLRAGSSESFFGFKKAQDARLGHVLLAGSLEVPL